MLDALTVGQLLQFRLKANPSKRDKKSHKTVELWRMEEQQQWLARQAVKHGFAVHTVDWIPNTKIYGRKPNQKDPIRIACVLMQGVLEITNRELFIKALCEGIGRGRAYGCGLLSIAKLT